MGADEQSNFNGGMNDRVSPEYVSVDQYALGKNLETRRGGLSSRRGSWHVRDTLKDSDGTGMEVIGHTRYRYPSAGKGDVILNAHYRLEDKQTIIYRSTPLLTDTRVAMVLPGEIIDKSEINFVQAYDYVYAVRDGEDPIRWDGDLDSDWTVVPDGLNGAMPQLRGGKYIYNRIWGYLGDDTISISDSLSENFNQTLNSFRVEQGDGTRLIALHPFGNGQVIAFKERGIAIISGASSMVDAGDLALQFIDDQVGCVAQHSVVSIGADVFFLGRDGVWTVKQTSEQNAMLHSIPLSEPIENEFKKIHWEYADKIRAVNFDNYYIITAPVDGSTVPNRLFAFDLLRRVWVGLWDFGTGPDNFAAIDIVRHLNRDYLIGVGEHGRLSILLRGIYKDFVTSKGQFLGSGIARIPAATDMTDFTDGRIDVRVLLSRYGNARPIIWSGVWTAAAANGSFLLTVANQFALGLSGTYDVTLYCNILGTYPVREWEGRVDIYGLRDGQFHDLSIIQDGVQPYLTVDGVRYEFEFTPASGSVNDDRTKWLKSSHSFPGLVAGTADLASKDGADWWGKPPVNAGGGGHWVDSFSVSTEQKTASPTTEVRLIDFQFNPGRETVMTTWIGDTPTGTTGQVTAPYPFGTSDSDLDELLFFTPTSNEVDIVSILLTRAFLLGGIMTQKNTIVGEVRFSHGQPNLTCEIVSDMPFDTETLVAMTAKTYSLTAYEVHGVDDWVAGNTNNDFGTPFREDYAPIPIGIKLGTNGFTIDVHRDHTEMFSTLLSAGWVQLRLTNTSGFIQYLALSLTASEIRMEQDGGSNAQ